MCFVLGLMNEFSPAKITYNGKQQQRNKYTIGFIVKEKTKQ